MVDTDEQGGALQAMTMKHTGASPNARLLGAAAAVLLAAFGHAPLAAHAANCASPATPAEKEVCADEELHSLSEHLSRYVAGAMAALHDGAQCFEIDQQQWTEAIRDACGDRECQTGEFRRRLAQLHALQPAATALTNIELPDDAPELVTVVPPAPEAESDSSGEPLEATGHLVWEQEDANNMGYALRGDDGVHVIVLDRDLRSSPTHEALRAAIENEASTTFRVIGARSPEGGFAMDQCRFVWRVR